MAPLKCNAPLGHLAIRLAISSALAAGGTIHGRPYVIEHNREPMYALGRVDTAVRIVADVPRLS